MWDQRRRQNTAVFIVYRTFICNYWVVVDKMLNACPSILAQILTTLELYEGSASKFCIQWGCSPQIQTLKHGATENHSHFERAISNASSEVDSVYSISCWFFLIPTLLPPDHCVKKCSRKDSKEATVVLFNMEIRIYTCSYPSRVCRQPSMCGRNLRLFKW